MSAIHPPPSPPPSSASVPTTVVVTICVVVVGASVVVDAAVVVVVGAAVVVVVGAWVVVVGAWVVVVGAAVVVVVGASVVVMSTVANTPGSMPGTVSIAPGMVCTVAPTLDGVPVDSPRTARARMQQIRVTMRLASPDLTKIPFPIARTPPVRAGGLTWPAAEERALQSSLAPWCLQVKQPQSRFNTVMTSPAKNCSTSSPKSANTNAGASVQPKP
jgi:hypothetical protein